MSAVACSLKKTEAIEWVDDQSSESQEESSGYYDEIWATNKPTTRYFYDGQMGFEDDFTTNPGGGPQVTVTRYALGARGIEGIETTTSQGSSAVYPVYDGNGNMIAALARNGPSFTRSNNRVYDAWGNVTSGSGGDQGYVANLGHRKDAESGLTYMRARYYEPGTGRFVSQDSARDGTNWYVYVRNNPVNLVDPTGCWAQALIAGFLNMAGMALGYIIGLAATSMMLTFVNPYYEPGSFTLEVIGLATAIGFGLAGMIASDVKQAVAGRMSIVELCKGICRSLARESNKPVFRLAFFGAGKIGMIFGVYTALLEYYMGDAYQRQLDDVFSN